MAKAVSLTVELVNFVNSSSDNLFNFAMYPSGHNCIPSKLVPCLDGW
jgi:hypothetical protein